MLASCQEGLLVAAPHPHVCTYIIWFALGYLAINSQSLPLTPAPFGLYLLTRTHFSMTTTFLPIELTPEQRSTMSYLHAAWEILELRDDARYLATSGTYPIYLCTEAEKPEIAERRRHSNLATYDWTAVGNGSVFADANIILDEKAHCIIASQVRIMCSLSCLSDLDLRSAKSEFSVSHKRLDTCLLPHHEEQHCIKGQGNVI